MPQFIGPPVDMNVDLALETLQLYLAGQVTFEEAIKALNFLKSWFAVYRREN